MRRLFLMVAILFAINTLIFAQNDVTKDEIASLYKQDITKFLGIPVDGTKEEMMQKLQEKGFQLNDKGVLEGEFNGRDVIVLIGTNKNKVYRIMLMDIIPSDKNSIKIRFNNLCSQFFNNKKYITYSKEEELIIPDEEDISYNMVVHNKQYKASFRQAPDFDIYASIHLKGDIPLTKEEEIVLMTNAVANKTVWFKIEQLSSDGYVIVMYYDNGNNEANGEDL